MQNASNGVSGNDARDGSLPSRAVASTADKLRNLADWLDAHPGATVHQVSFIDVNYDGTARVSDFGAGSPGVMEDRAQRIGGEWECDDSDTMWALRQAIMPGLEFRITTSKPKPAEGCPVPDDESDVPF
jgi:hypothetical protein